MTFNDHILARRLPYNHAAAQARVDALCAMMMRLLGNYASGQYVQYWTLLELAKTMRQEIGGFIKAAMAQRRSAHKLNMLRHPEWRSKVLRDLGGRKALLRCWKAQFREKPKNKKERIKRRKLVLTEEEARRRAHIRYCAKAALHPHVTRDPFKVDQEGEFRLPPVARHFTGKVDESPRDYEYRAEPLCDFTGLKTPIMVLPEEFMAFMDMDMDAEAEEKERETAPLLLPMRAVRRESVRAWLSGLQDNVYNKVKPLEPVLKVHTARGPPVLLPV